MTDGEKQVKGPAKTIRVSTDMHTRFKRFQHNVHADSADQAMTLLLADDVLHIPMPAAVMQRWKDEAAVAGFSIEHWVAQRVEAYLANRAHAGEVRAALNELLTYRRVMGTAAQAYEIHRGQMPQRPAGPSEDAPRERP